MHIITYGQLQIWPFITLVTQHVNCRPQMLCHVSSKRLGSGSQVIICFAEFGLMKYEIYCLFVQGMTLVNINPKGIIKQG